MDNIRVAIAGIGNWIGRATAYRIAATVREGQFAPLT